MDSSRLAFLLARFFALLIWWGAFADATYLPDRLFQVGSYHTAASRHYYGGFLALLVLRVLLFLVLGLLVWWNARKVARWLEGKKEEEHRVDAPPLASP